MGERRFVGAHWRAGRWIAVAFDAEGLAAVRTHGEVGDLWAEHGERAALVLVDVPVGLGESTAERPPDALARLVLGPRAGDVVAPPVREATRKRRYPVASRVHERRTGAALSERAFALCEPIAALDELLGEVPEARETVAEAHPEVCFRAFAGAPLEHPRESAKGYAERMRALAEFDRDAPPTVQSAAAAVGDEAVTVPDVLDALALAYTARPGPGELRSLPADPPTDDSGRPMRTCYRSSSPLDA